jgi:hypothetical protein
MRSPNIQKHKYMGGGNNKEYKKIVFTQPIDDEVKKSLIELL